MKLKLAASLLLTFIAAMLIRFATVTTGNNILSVASVSTTGDTSNPYTLCNRFSSIEYLSYPDSSSLDKPNNKFGIYIYAEEERFFKLADKLVNSNGGDWGYVLIPYNVKDRDSDRWKRVFTDVNKRHLIPIVQLWDVDPKDYKEDTIEAAAFLNSFLWPVKEHYISVYNEPNDDRFWKNDANPKNYAHVLEFTINAFKRENPDFFIMNGALNSSAPEGNGYINAVSFLYQMNQEIPGIFEELDGWASHSYPQPNFAGNPYDTGLWSIKAYDSELNYLKNTLGVKKDLPVFITETGWAHAEGKNYNGSYVTAKKAAEYIKTAYEQVWLKDTRVRAVTPFTILYSAPHDHFSWINDDGVPYEQYETVKEIKKVKGEPATLSTTTLQMSKCEN